MCPFHKGMKWFSRSVAGFLSAIAGALLVVACFHLTSWGEGVEPAIKVETTPVNRDARLGASFAPVVKKAAPGVVNIYSTRIVHERLDAQSAVERSAFPAIFRQPVPERRPETHTAGTKSWLRSHRFSGRLYFDRQSCGGRRGRNQSPPSGKTKRNMPPKLSALIRRRTWRF